MGSLRKNGRLGDPALPSLSSNSFHVEHSKIVHVRMPGHVVENDQILNIEAVYRKRRGRQA
jgi:hypothetical protein